MLKLRFGPVPHLQKSYNWKGANLGFKPGTAWSPKLRFLEQHHVFLPMRGSELTARQPGHSQEGFTGHVCSPCAPPTTSAALSPWHWSTLTALLEAASSILQELSSPESSLGPSARLAGLLLWGTTGGRCLKPTSHLGQGTRKRNGQHSPVHSYLLSTTCQRGSPIKWLFRAFETTNQTCQIFKKSF